MSDYERTFSDRYVRPDGTLRPIPESELRTNVLAYADETNSANVQLRAELSDARAEAARWRKACEDESLAKSTAVQRVAELERELAETQGALESEKLTVADMNEDATRCLAELAAERKAHAETRAKLERSQYKGCGSYPRAIGEIEGILGISGEVPLSETVAAVKARICTPAERAVLDACDAIPEQELNSSGNWYGWTRPIGVAIRAWKLARRGEKP